MQRLLRITMSFRLVPFLIACILIFASAKFGQYLFFTWQTSPAVLWPVTGIGVAIMWVWGYRYALPILMGLLIASVTGPTAHVFPGVFTTPLAQVIGEMAIVYFLRYFGFSGSFGSLRSVLTFLIVIALASTVTPTISTLISWLADTLAVAPYVSWSRAWAGYMLSTLILTPFILTWFYKEEAPGPKHSYLESLAAGFVLVIAVYFLFWTQIGAQFSFLLFALFFIAHFWIGYRFSGREMMLATLFSTVFGIAGLFLSPSPNRDLNDQLFAAELFLFLVVPIFYCFSALIKERANTIRELKLALDRIERESTTKNEFIAMLAHELRNPLAPVKTTLEILGMRDLQPDMKHLIESAHRQVHAMRRILDDLLDMTRVTQGKFQLQIEHASLTSMIMHCVESMEETFTRRQQKLTIHSSAPSEIYLDVDPVRFEQVITNIFSNASKYTPHGGNIQVTYGVRGHLATIIIKDDGMGIEAENLPDIFQPFWQVPSASVRAGTSGIGVGLSLTKRIVEMHGGSIIAQSEGRNKGTTFTITIPISSRVYDAPRTEAKPAVTTLQRVLVVDDNKAAADALAKLLSMKNHQADIAYSGLEVFERVQSFDPTIVLLDIGLPDMDGYAVAQKLRADGFKGKVVAVSGFGQKEDKEKAFASGFDHHITKPMSIKSFEDYLRNLDSLQSPLL